MADRVAVMKDGEILQIGTPTDLYSHPQSPFIADFVGKSNILDGKIISRDNGDAVVQIGEQSVKSFSNIEKEDVKLFIRPESIDLVDENSRNYDNYFEGTIQFATYLGSTVRYDIKVGKYQLIADTVYESGDNILDTGTKVKLGVSPERVLLI